MFPRKVNAENRTHIPTTLLLSSANIRRTGQTKNKQFSLNQGITQTNIYIEKGKLSVTIQMNGSVCQI